MARMQLACCRMRITWTKSLQPVFLSRCQLRKAEREEKKKSPHKYYSAIKKNEIMPLAPTWMDLEIVILSEVSQRKRNIIWYRLYVESKKEMIQMNLFTKQKQTHRLKRRNLWLPQRGPIIES